MCEINLFHTFVQDFTISTRGRNSNLSNSHFEPILGLPVANKITAGFLPVPCAPGTYSQTGVGPCLPCPKGRYQPSRKQTSCLLCGSGKSTYGEGASTLKQCIGECMRIDYYKTCLTEKKMHEPWSDLSLSIIRLIQCSSLYKMSWAVENITVHKTWGKNNDKCMIICVAKEGKKPLASTN